MTPKDTFGQEVKIHTMDDSIPEFRGFELVCPVCKSKNQIVRNNPSPNHPLRDGIIVPIFGMCGSEWEYCFLFQDYSTYVSARLVKSCKDTQLTPIELAFLKEAKSAIEGIEPQYWIGQYRVDFAIPDKKVVVELDGHDYHKTKEQRTNDAQRERYLELEGWRVIRFTGSEIHKNAAKCVAQANELIKKWANQEG